MNLEDIERFTVPASVVEHTVASLREAGREGFERFVLWSGACEGRTLRVSTAHVPEQTASKTSRGLIVRVEGDALHGLNAWLYRNEEVLAVQVHAHPTDAFHSGTDDTYPIVTSVGGLSIVVPDFARNGFFVRGLEGYRLTASGWRRVAPRKLKRLVEVV